MSDKNFLLIIYDFYQHNNDIAVIELWEKNKDYDFNFACKVDKNACDAISNSYLEIGNYKRSLHYINKRIGYIVHNEIYSPYFNISHSDVDFYFNMKSHIFSLQNKEIREFFTLKQYRKIGGSNQTILNSYYLTKKIILQNYINPTTYIFSLFYICFIILHHLFNVPFIGNSIYITFIIFGLALLAFLLWLRTSFIK